MKIETCRIANTTADLADGGWAIVAVQNRTGMAWVPTISDWKDFCRARDAGRFLNVQRREEDAYVLLARTVTRERTRKPLNWTQGAPGGWKRVVG